MSEKPEYVPVQIAPCNAYQHVLIAESWFRVEGDVVVLATQKGVQRYDIKGKPMRHKLQPGETARKIAWRLTKDHMPKRRSDFNRPLNYPSASKF